MKKSVFLISILLMTGFVVADAEDEINIISPDEGTYGNDEGDFNLTFEVEVTTHDEDERDRTVDLGWADDDEGDTIDQFNMESGETQSFTVDFEKEVEDEQGYDLVGISLIEEEDVGHETFESQTVHLVNTSSVDEEEIEFEDEQLFGEEQTIDLTDIREEVEGEQIPDFVFSLAEILLPEQRINIELTGELSDEFFEDIAEDEHEEVEAEEMKDIFEDELLPENKDASMKLDNDIEELTISPSTHEEPNIEIDIDMEVTETIFDPDEESMDAGEEEFLEFYEEGKIEVEAKGVRNRIFLSIVETFVGV